MGRGGVLQVRPRAEEEGGQHLQSAGQVRGAVWAVTLHTRRISRSHHRSHNNNNYYFYYHYYNNNYNFYHDNNNNNYYYNTYNNIYERAKNFKQSKTVGGTKSINRSNNNINNCVSD